MPSTAIRNLYNLRDQREEVLPQEIDFIQASKDEEFIKKLEADPMYIRTALLSGDKDLALIASKFHPSAAILLYPEHKNEEMLLTAAKRDPDMAVQAYEEHRNDKTLIVGSMLSPSTSVTFPEKYESSPVAKEVYRKAVWQAVNERPSFILRDFDPDSIFPSKGSIKRILGREEAEAVLKAAAYSASLKDPNSALGFFRLYGDKPYAQEIRKTALRLMDYSNVVGDAENIGDRELMLKNIFNNINPNIIDGLREFNKQTGLSMQPMGIYQGSEGDSSKPYEFIFLNTFSGSDTTPLAIGLTMEDLKKVKSKEDSLNLFNKKYEQEKKLNSNQRGLWNNGFVYDIPPNGKTNVMFALAPDYTKGQETDVARLSEIYRDRYGASIVAVNMQNKDKWESIPDVKEQIEGDKLPQTKGASKKEILETLEASLKKSIDEGKSTFLFHYMMHGQEEGTMAAATDKKSPPPNWLISPTELIDIFSSEYNGKPISEQIDLLVVADSCFSGRQLERMVTNLKQKDTPVKNLTIVSASSKDKVSSTCMTPSSASLISDKMKSDNDWSSALSYYLTSYYELMDYNESKGIKANGPVGTFSHAAQFMDMMVTRDSIHGAKPQAIHYSNDPKKKKVINNFFSQMDTISEDSAIKDKA